MPSSRHRVCPACRRLARRNPCPICNNLKERRAKFCRPCHFTQVQDNIKTGSKTYTKKGYVAVRVLGKNGKASYRFEHVLLMEEALGRSLLPGENVHHINGIRGDNRIENLELWIRPQPTGIRVDDAVAWAKEILSRYGQ